MNSMNLRTAVITGGAQGLGYACAEELAKQPLAPQNWRLILLDIDAVKLEQAKQQLEQNGVYVETYLIDLLQPEEVSGWLAGFCLAGWPIDLLINNAGITHRSSANYTDMAVFEKIMQLNWQVPVKLTQGLLPALKAGGGTVVVVGSMAGWLPLPGRAAYCASKAAVSQHFETWRPELKRRGIKLLMAYPSFLHTNIENHALGIHGQPVNTARSTVGKVQSAKHMAQRILAACENEKSRVWGTQLSARLGYYLWHLTPALFQRLSWKRFNEDIVRGD